MQVCSLFSVFLLQHVPLPPDHTHWQRRFIYYYTCICHPTIRNGNADLFITTRAFAVRPTIRNGNADL
jgi:hypothetical protein